VAVAVAFPQEDLPPLRVAAAFDSGLVGADYEKVETLVAMQFETIAGAMPSAGWEGSAVKEYFEAQCDLFGLDPKTFMPRECALRDLQPTSVFPDERSTVG
jgi:hypothetical protein